MTDILQILDREWKEFTGRSYGRLPTVLILPEKYVDDYERALSFMMRYSREPPNMPFSIRHDHARHRDALVIVSKWVQEPEFAWTPDRIGP